MRVKYVVQRREHVVGSREMYGERAYFNKGIFDTLEEAEALASSFELPDYDDCHDEIFTDACFSDYVITKLVMNEETFTVTEEIVKTFSYWKEVGAKILLDERIKDYQECEQKILARKPRTEKSIAKKEKDLADMYERRNRVIESITRDSTIGNPRTFESMINHSYEIICK